MGCKHSDSALEHPSKTGKIGLRDFTIMKKLGEGAFSKVYLVKHNLSREKYAMKSINKKIVE